MKKIRVFISKHLDKMICTGGSFVIVCATLKFMNVPQSDLFFCLSLIAEAIIFFLGAIKPSENLYKENYEPVSGKMPQPKEKFSTEKAFYMEIQEEIKKINERINERIGGNNKNEEEEVLELSEMLKRIKVLSDKVNILSLQTKKIEEKFSNLKNATNEEQEKTSQSLKKRGRPRKKDKEPKTMFNNDK